MGTEFCKNCNSNRYVLIEKNLSNKNYPDEENNLNQMIHLINGQKKYNEFENDINIHFNDNENENDITHYDNPLYNTSLDESMNLGNCYIGTNKNMTKIKPYNPENSLQTVMNKKRLSLEPKMQPNKFPFNKKMNKTSKNFNKKNIKYNLLFNNNKNTNGENNILEKGYYYNNSNKKNQQKYNNMGFFSDSAQNSIKADKSLDNINKLIKKINTNNSKNKAKKILNLNDQVPETYEEENIYRLKNIYLKYNVQILKKIYNNIINNKKRKIDNNNNKDNNINNINIDNNTINNENTIGKNKLINSYIEIYDIFNDENNSEELDVNLVPEKRHIFIGSKINNLKNGFGLDIFTTFNSYYCGKFINNKRIGFAKYKINNKNNNYKYEGEVDSLHASGYGRFINFETNMIYEGEWKNSLKNGIGIEKYRNNLYKGNFVNGKRNGIGEYFWEKDIYYIGEWRDNLMNGEGIYHFSKNACYEGSFKNNKIEGFGILNVKQSKIYIGFFKNDYKNGFGIKIWDSEKKAYVGFWKDNKHDGFGKMFKKDKIQYAIYQNGNIVNEVHDQDQINRIYNDINKYFSLLFDLRNYNEVKAKVYEIMNI